MKKIYLICAALFIAIACLIGCKNRPKTETSEIVEESGDAGTMGISDMEAVKQYLIEEIGTKYAEGDYCVPVLQIIYKEEKDNGEILVWGDFWVYNYDLVGDTLKCVSGGNHSGLMHVRLGEDKLTYEVISFDQVEDGVGNTESAKRIFGDRYDEFHEINSNHDMREHDRSAALADFVKTNNIPASLYQDYGWPAQRLPK